MDRSNRSQADGFGGRTSAQQPDASIDVPYGPRTLGASGDLVVQLDRGGVPEPVAAGGDPGAASGRRKPNFADGRLDKPSQRGSTPLCMDGSTSG